MAAEPGFNEYARYVSLPVAMPGALDEWGGKLHFFRFSATQGVDCSMLNGDTSPILQLRKGWRVLGGFVAFEAGGAGALLSIGILGALTKYSATIDVSAAGSSTAIANTIALNHGESLAADAIIQASFTGANFAAGKKIAGYLMIGMAS